MANYAKIKKFDTSNGEGIGVSIFFSGCKFACKGCFNEELWDFNYGEPMTKQVIDGIMDTCSNEHIGHLSILGGEPLHGINIETTLDICMKFKKAYPDKKLWLWTGSTLEELLIILCSNVQQSSAYKACLDRIIYEYVDYLIEGRYIEEEKNLKLKWRGSENQNVIDLKETLIQREMILKDW